jgi:hypothetical protein
MLQDIPTITASSYTSSVVDPMLGGLQALHQISGGNDFMKKFEAMAQQVQPEVKPQPQGTIVTARIVKVYIADSNDNLPLDKRVIYSGDEKLTDLTDQELYFEVPIAELLAKHNEVRAKTVDKKQSEKFGRDIYLEPARIRDLKMVVVNVATF